MALYPSSPEPRVVPPLPYERIVVRNQFDGGAIATRAKYLKRRVTGLQLEYLGHASEFMVIADFWDEVAGGTLPFEFLYPYPQTVATGTPGTPYTIVTVAPHGYQTGEQVGINNVGVSDGAYTITRITPTSFSLDGTSGGTPVSAGIVTRYFPRMGFLGNIFGPFRPTLGFGAPVDDQGMLGWSVTLEER